MPTRRPPDLEPLRNRPARRSRTTHPTPAFERLEDRCVLSTIAWDGGPGGGGTLLDLAANWVGDVLPGPSDTAIIATAGPDIQLDSAAALSVGALRLVPPAASSGRLVRISGALTIGTVDVTFVGRGGRLVLGNFGNPDPAILQGMGSIEVQAAGPSDPAGLLAMQGGTIDSGPFIENLGSFIGIGTLRRGFRNHTGGFAQIGALHLEGGSISNFDDATLNFVSVTTLTGSGASGEGVFNFGLIQRIAPGFGYFVDVPFSNNPGGRVFAGVGTLHLRHAGGFNGLGSVMEAAPGATLRLGESGPGGPFQHSDGSSLIANGTIDLQGPHTIASTAAFPTSWTGSGTLIFTGSQPKTFNNDLPIDIATTQIAGATAGTGVVTISGTLDFATEGSIANTVIVNPAGHMTWTGFSHTISGRLVNNSTDPANRWDASAGNPLIFNNGVFENNGQFHIHIVETSTIPITASGSGANTVLNTGTLTITSAGAHFLLSTSFTLNNPGTIRALSGGLEIDGPIAQVVSGRLTGGTWEAVGPAFFDAAVKPRIIGAAARVLFSNNVNASRFIASNLALETEALGEWRLVNSDASTTSSFTHRGLLFTGPGSTVSSLTGNFQPTATFHTIISGLNPATQMGRFTTTSSLALRGTLRVEFAPPLVPAIGQVFTIMTASSISGDFDAIQLPDLSAQGLLVTAEKTATQVNIRVVQGPPPVITWTGLGNGFSWFDPLNWNIRVPQANDVVSIPDVAQTTQVVFDNPAADISLQSLTAHEPLAILAGRLDFEGDSGIDSLDLGAGTVGGAGNLTIDEWILRFGSQFSNTGSTTVTGPATLAGGGPGGLGDYLFAGSRLEFRDILTAWTSGKETLHLQNTEIVFTNAEINTPGIIEISGETGSNQVRYAGSVTKSGPGTLRLQGDALQLSQVAGATLTVVAGTHAAECQSSWLGNGISASAPPAAPAPSLEFRGGGSFGPAAAISGSQPARITFDAGSYQVNSNISVTGQLTVEEDATLNCLAPQAFSALVTVRGAIAGNAVCTYNAGLETYPGAALQNAGGTSIGPGSSFVVAAGTGLSQPAVTVLGGLTLTPSSQLVLDLNDRSDFGRLQITGTLQAAGTLRVRFLSDFYRPKAGESSRLLSASEITGSFNQTLVTAGHCTYAFGTHRVGGSLFLDPLADLSSRR